MIEVDLDMLMEMTPREIKNCIPNTMIHVKFSVVGFFTASGEFEVQSRIILKPGPFSFWEIIWRKNKANLIVHYKGIQTIRPIKMYNHDIDKKVYEFTAQPTLSGAHSFFLKHQNTPLVEIFKKVEKAFPCKI